MSHLHALSSPRQKTFIADRARWQWTAAFLFVIILVLHGTYLRLRPANEIPTLDWVVLARLLACGAGAAVGVLMIPRGTSWGIGAKLLLAYALASVVTSFPSDYLVTSLGYSLLLLGLALLMIGMIYSAGSVEQVKRIERIWMVTVAILMVKDALTGLLMPVDPLPGEVVRMGMGLTHANQLSLHAAILFWMSFGSGKPKHRTLTLLLRGFCLIVLVAAVSRGSFMAFVLGGLMFALFRGGRLLDRSILATVGTATVLSVFLLGLSFGQGWAGGILDYLVRGQDRTQLTSMTGRTAIWSHAIHEGLQSPLYGHGYGVSRFVMGSFQSGSPFTPAHAHNSFLEVFISSGILGLIPFFFLVVYCFRWVTRYFRLRKALTPDVANHAISVMVMLTPVLMIESAMAARITPVSALAFFYLLLLDREGHFRNMRELELHASEEKVQGIGFKPSADGRENRRNNAPEAVADGAA